MLHYTSYVPNQDMWRLTYNLYIVHQNCSRTTEEMHTILSLQYNKEPPLLSHFLPASSLNKNRHTGKKQDSVNIQYFKQLQSLTNTLPPAPSFFYGAMMLSLICRGCFCSKRNASTLEFTRLKTNSTHSELETSGKCCSGSAV